MTEPREKSHSQYRVEGPSLVILGATAAGSTGSAVSAVPPLSPQCPNATLACAAVRVPCVVICELYEPTALVSEWLPCLERQPK